MTVSLILYPPPVKPLWCDILMEGKGMTVSFYIHHQWNTCGVTDWWNRMTVCFYIHHQRNTSSLVVDIEAQQGFGPPALPTQCDRLVWHNTHNYDRQDCAWYDGQQNAEELSGFVAIFMTKIAILPRTLLFGYNYWVTSCHLNVLYTLTSDWVWNWDCNLLVLRNSVGVR